MHDTTISHFADDTCIIFSSKKNENHGNHELKLCTNRLSLNVDQFFNLQRLYEYSNFSIKLNSLKINPADYVKYLGVYHDKNLS